MITQSRSHPDVRSVLVAVRELRRLGAGASDLHARFAAVAAMLCRGDLAVVVARSDGEWQATEVHDAVGIAETERGHLLSCATRLADRATANGYAMEPVEPNAVMIGVALEGRKPAAVVAVLLTRHTQAQQRDAAIRLHLIADIPATPTDGANGGHDTIDLAKVLDLIVTVVGKDSFAASAVTLCNELAARFGCMRVSLGWSDRQAAVRVRAISHIERFDVRTDSVRGLEAAMEEAIDQDESLIWPGSETRGAVMFAHERFARRESLRQILSLLLHQDDEPVGVVVCERADRTFTDDELRLLHLAANLLSRWLTNLYRHDRPWHQRLRHLAGEAAAALSRPRHTAAKATIAAGVALVLFGVFGRIGYTVDAPALLKTDQLAYLPVPFDGYIETVEVEVGDLVEKGRTLVTLDTAELYLKESEATADIHRFARAADKARAQGQLADMLISEAQVEQARARLERVGYYLSHAEMTSPIDGILVEGDHKGVHGAPVKKGDVLFKVMRLEDFYFEVYVDERDVQDVGEDAVGEVSFLSRPDVRFPVRIDTINPMAEIKSEYGNVFVARAVLVGDSSAWWRPGMSGLVRLEASARSPLWIAFHRTIDFLRLHFWL